MNKWPLGRILIWCIGASIVAILYLYWVPNLQLVRWYWPWQPQSSETKQPQQVHFKLEDERQPKKDPALPEVDETERKARVKARLYAARALGKDSVEWMDALSEQLSIWDTRTKTLLTDDTGKKLAANPAAVDQLDSLLAKPRIKKLAVESMRGRLEALLEPVEKGLRADDGRYHPSAELLAELEGIGKQASEAMRQLTQDNLVLRTVLDDSANAKPNAVSLEEAMAKRREELTRKEAEALAESNAKARAQAAEKVRVAEAEAILKLGEAEAEAKRFLGDAEAKRLRDQTAIERKKLQDQAEAAKRQAEKDKLLRLAKDPVVQGKYQAFLALGLYQFDTSGLGTGRKGKRPEPISLGDLTKNGWLDSSQKFALALSKKPHPDYNVFNDRPTRPYPKTQAEWTEMDRMLEEFRVLAPVWVELKVLRP